MMLTSRTLITCFLRTYLVGAAFNTRGLQNVGIVYAMEPGLKAIYPDEKERKTARKRYIKHYNTHPFWSPLLVGTFLSLEAMIATGKVPAQVLTSLKDTTTYTLSAIGDSVFGGSFLVFWSLCMCSLLLSGHLTIAFVSSLLLFLGLQVFKALTFIAGLRGGLKVLTMLKGWDLINWGERLKLVNAVLVVLLLHLTWPGTSDWQSLGVASVGILLLGWTIGRLHLSRIIILFCLSALALAVPQLIGPITFPW